MNLDRDGLRALFSALNDGTISESDHGKLERILEESAEARQMWFLHCDIETGLADWAAARSTVVVPQPFFPAKRSPSFRWLAPLAAAAIAMVAAFFWPRPPASPPVIAEAPANGVALLARAVGVEWDGVSYQPGAVLSPSTLRLKTGAALVEFYNGARVVLEAPAELRLIGAGEAFLASGKLNAHVPPQARGFTVNSASLKVVDHGTDFAFEVKRGAAPEVHVFTGKVEVASAVVAPRALNAGEAVRFSDGVLAAIVPMRAAFLTEAELAHRDNERARVRLAAWKQTSRALSGERSTVLHYTFDESSDAARTVENQVPAATPDSHGGIVGGTWGEGRWEGLHALHFRSGGDRVRFRIAEPMQAMTLLAWIRVDSLPRAQNVLLSSESERPGAVHWHMTNHGEIRLELARDLGRPIADWEAVNSAPFVTAERLGQWLMLATTFDGKTIRHYGNGQPIGAGASFTPPTLEIGGAELGNWRGTTQRQLAGAFDEFAILSRALSDEEVMAIFKAGER
jgi:hypothetical protein